MTRTTYDTIVICRDCGAHMHPSAKWIKSKMSFWVCKYCNGRNENAGD